MIRLDKREKTENQLFRDNLDLHFLDVKGERGGQNITDTWSKIAKKSHCQNLVKNTYGWLLCRKSILILTKLS